jgi:CheY-like chemotaxis protein
MDPTGCNVLLVGSTYLDDGGRGSYVQRTACPHVTSYGRKYLTGPCHCDRYQRPQDAAAIQEETRQSLEFIQALLETYSHVTAVTCGQVALSSLHNQHPLRNTILLIDLDHFAPKEEDVAKHDSGVELDDMYGLDFLKIVTEELQLGQIKHVYPIVCSRNPSPDLMTHCLNLGAADYLVKPIGSEVVKTLWLNVLRRLRKDDRFQIPINAMETSRLRSSNGNHVLEDRLTETFSRDATLAEMIVNFYAPRFQRINPLDFPRLDERATRERRAHLRSKLTSWSFSPHALSEDDLLRCVEIVFLDVLSLDGLEMIHVTESLLHHFILAIRSSYRDDNPYHDFYHAVDVLQATYYTCCSAGLIPGCTTDYRAFEGAESAAAALHIDTERLTRALHRILRPRDLFALMVASLGHDVGHPGVNNYYMINARTPLAELYNDQSVLENYHATSLFLLMRKHGLSFHDNNQSAAYKEFRATVVNAILATDMSTHFDYVRRIHGQTERIRMLGDADSDLEVTEEDRRLLIAAIIKCADICNTSRPFDVAKHWCEALMREFSRQSELEKKMGMPVSMPIEDSPVAQAKSQIDFISALAMPLFAAVAQVIPQLYFTVDQLTTNKAIWEDVRKAELAAATAAEEKHSASIRSKPMSREHSADPLVRVSSGEESDTKRTSRPGGVTGFIRRISFPSLRSKSRPNSQSSTKSATVVPATEDKMPRKPSPVVTPARPMSGRLSVCSQSRFSDAVTDYLFS